VATWIRRQSLGAEHLWPINPLNLFSFRQKLLFLNPTKKTLEKRSKNNKGFVSLNRSAVFRD